jgi:hypothetical protein
MQTPFSESKQFAKSATRKTKAHLEHPHTSEFKQVFLIIMMKAIIEVDEILSNPHSLKKQIAEIGHLK